MHSELTAEQVRGARAMLRLTQDELAAASGLTPRIIANVEASHGVLGGRRRAVAQCLVAALSGAGVVFLEGQGVRLGSAQEAGTR